MKKLLPFILLIAGGIWFATQSQNNLFSKFLGYFAELEPASTPSLSVKAFTSKDLERRRMTIDDLPEDGSYTIIFLHTSDCTLCASMNDSLSVLIDKRNDIALRKVSVNRPFNSNQRLAELNFQKELQDNYDVISLPAVHIYGPNKEVLAKDDMLGENGEEFILNWLEVERAASK